MRSLLFKRGDSRRKFWLQWCSGAYVTLQNFAPFWGLTVFLRCLLREENFQKQRVQHISTTMWGDAVYDKANLKLIFLLLHHRWRFQKDHSCCCLPCMQYIHDEQQETSGVYYDYYVAVICVAVSTDRRFLRPLHASVAFKIAWEAFRCFICIQRHLPRDSFYVRIVVKRTFKNLSAIRHNPFMQYYCINIVDRPVLCVLDVLLKTMSLKI